MNAAAFDTEDYAKVDGNPFNFAAGTAVGAPAITLVVVAYSLE